MPSRLTAIGAPTRTLWTQLGWIYTGLVIAFGFGLWNVGVRNRAVRIVGGLILAYASLGLLWPFAPMHQREVLAAARSTEEERRRTRGFFAERRNRRAEQVAS